MRTFIFALLFVAGFGFSATGPAAFFVENTHLNLPAASRGETVTAEVHFTNNAAVPVEIVKVKTPCGCTTVNLEKTVQAPGESGSFTVQVDTSRQTKDYDKTIKVIVQGDGEEMEIPVRLSFPITQ